ncbi:MAG: hypothetical protein HC929_10430 [Leptolyngbyaceae cyanobacterium SM2_5_2]|nr:hypothetical protein [Leptolyngbyaceae cyanobacterium SM2_5_2]
MFLDELSPFVQELLGHPTAFLGGFASGLLRLSLMDEPVKSWLSRQGMESPTASGVNSHHQNGGGPQTIAID